MQIPEKYQEDKQVKCIAIIVSSFIDSQETSILINDYLATFTENNQRTAYLKFLRSIIEEDCSSLNNDIHELWKFTGVNSLTLQYKEICQLES